MVWYGLVEILKLTWYGLVAIVELNTKPLMKDNGRYRAARAAKNPVQIILKKTFLMSFFLQHMAPVLAGMWGAKMSGGHSGDFN